MLDAANPFFGMAPARQEKDPESLERGEVYTLEEPQTT